MTDRKEIFLNYRFVTKQLIKQNKPLSPLVSVLLKNEDEKS
jgi:hypothetical protein